MTHPPISNFVFYYHLPVACWSRYLNQVFPLPGNEAKATGSLGGLWNLSCEHHFTNDFLGGVLRPRIPYSKFLVLDT